MLKETDFVQEIISKYTVHQFPNDINNVRGNQNFADTFFVCFNGWLMMMNGVLNAASIILLYSAYGQNE